MTAAIGVLLAFGIALVFASSVAAHLGEPKRIGDAVEKLGAPRWMGWAAAGTEAGLVVALVLSPRLGGLLSASYLAVLMVVFGWAVTSGHDIEDCACGRTKHRVDIAWFIRNLTLMGGGLAIAALAPTGANRLVWPVAIAAALVVGVVLELRSGSRAGEHLLRQ